MRSVYVRSFCAIALISILTIALGKDFWRLGNPIGRSQRIILIAILSSVLIIIAWGIYDYLMMKRRIDQEKNRSDRFEKELSRCKTFYEDLISEKAVKVNGLTQKLADEIAQHKKTRETAILNEVRFRNMADNIEEGLTIIEDGKIVYINKSACDILGQSLNEKRTIPNELEFLTPEGRDGAVHQSENAFQMSGSPNELEYWVVRKDGSRRRIHDHYSVSRTGGKERYFIVTTDITEQVQAYQILEQAVQERTRELSTVLEISKNITSMLELEPLLRIILEQIKPVIPYNGAAIFSLNNETLEALTYQSPRSSKWPYPVQLSLSNAGACREVVQQRHVLVLEDIHGDTPLSRALKETSNGKVKLSFSHAHAWIGIPLVIKDKVVGLLSLTHEQPNFYTQTHTRVGLAIANQVAVAMENARLYEHAHELATIEERQRIAGELHDSVTQLLYGICLYSSAAIKSSGEKDLHFTNQLLTEIKENALQALQEMRLLIYELYPPMLEDAGLVSALRICLDSVRVRTGLQTELRAEGMERLPAPLERELYRVALEALSNLLKYAKAKTVSISLHLEDGIVHMEICDNGIGFNINEAKSAGGLGLKNMERRVKQIGGTIEIISTPEAGTKVKIAVNAAHEKALQTQELEELRI